ncbi:MAG: sigma-70 family RNA polymerase sigma factor [Ruminococcus callidus]
MLRERRRHDAACNNMGKLSGRTASVGGGSGGHRKRRTAAGTAETTEPPRAGTGDETLYRLCGNVTRGQTTQEDLEELTADVFLALWHHAPEMRTEHLTGYLASIARSKGYNWLRKNRPETMPIDDVVISDDTDVSAQAEQAELAGIVQEMLAQLPEQDRELLLRFYFYRQSVREIAGEMHMKESTVKTRMYRSRKKLRQLFTERGYGYEQMELV